MLFDLVHVLNVRCDVNAPVPTYVTAGHPRELHALVLPSTAFCVTSFLSSSGWNESECVTRYSSV